MQLLFLLTLISIACATKCAHKRPVLMIHGILSSQLMLEADVPESYTLPGNCPHQLKGQIWVNKKDIYPFNDTQCFVAYMNTEWDGKKMENVPGVKITYPNYPSTEGISSLGVEDQSVAYRVLRLFYKMIQGLSTDGWVDNQDMFAPGYDWRYANRQRDDWIAKTKELVKSAVEKTKLKAVLVTHSYGGPMAMEFFDAVGKEFCDKYIDKIITVASPFIGATKALQTFLSGETFGLPMDPSTLRKLARSWEGSIQLMPNAKYWENAVIAEVAGKKYTAQQVEEVLELVPEVKEYIKPMYEECMDRYPMDHVPNNVPIHCLYSHGIDTVYSLKYDDLTKDFQDGNFTYGDGDGTVDIQSLLWCAQPSFNATVVKDMGKVGHADLIKDKSTITYVRQQSCSAVESDFVE
ncbi:1-O-acylceramide synthase precursor, putative [Entamoeba invadens IP1]|uniref:1-O-acylceramide synthase, putative n=1 Tax=Entamoeba invadens IP1 TaxID=370355 RepID=A0A0A1UC46_ENTIV|nr:1-O-acylceramide synthase precursor, putative [Entamoeba invadens IP1]ELP91283.1 1-O-acylceramide synthase precursor, putative [Entamoeba invadens IP1]|eukprot:XP_004258054.1 1-O-acylceramide synthase precursor, putative [Entamoeba invadens IP1]